MVKIENSIEESAIARISDNDYDGSSRDRESYGELLELSYNFHQPNLIPNRFKWGKSFIQVMD